MSKVISELVRLIAMVLEVVAESTSEKAHAKIRAEEAGGEIPSERSVIKYRPPAEAWDGRVVLQDDPGLVEPVRKWGCFFRSILRHCEIIADRLLSVEQINSIYAECIQGYSTLSDKEKKEMRFVMSDKCTMGRNHDEVSAVALRVLGVEGKRVLQVGAVRNPAPGPLSEYQVSDPSIYWGWVRGTQWQGADFTVLRGRTKRIAGHPELGLHFRYGDKRAVEQFDPHSLKPKIIEETAYYLYRVRDVS